MDTVRLPGEPPDAADEARRIVAKLREQDERVARAVEATAAAAGVTAQAADTTAKVAERTPSPLETFAIAVASTAAAIVLAGVVLIVIADVVNLVDPIDIWPLVTLALAIVAIAALSGTVGRRRRPIDLIPGARDMQRQLDALDRKLDRALPPGGAIADSSDQKAP